jgi:prophage tail gpP-like protein
MPELVAIQLDSGEQYGRWSEVEIVRSLDAYTALSVSGPFDHARVEVRRAFQPFAFPRVEVTVEGELVLTGRVKDVAPHVEPAMASVGVTVYSLPHDLTEICPANELLPLEFNGLDLRQIAAKLVTPSIGVESIFEGKPGATFARVKAEADNEIHPFLVDLALQRAFVLSDAPNGALLFRSEAKPGAPVARLEGQPLVRVAPSFDPSNWFSTITGRASRKAGAGGSRYSEFNPLYRASHPRPFTLRLDDTESADVPRAAKAAIGRMVASCASYSIEDLPSWRDPKGALWAPNTTVTLLAPEAMIYTETEFLIRTVTLRQSPESETASLLLVLPGTFGGALPSRLPWDF